MKEKTPDSEKLRELYKDKKCVYCSRSSKETTLNIEGFIHHHEPFRCLDIKECRRRRKR